MTERLWEPLEARWYALYPVGKVEQLRYGYLVPPERMDAAKAERNALRTERDRLRAVVRENVETLGHYRIHLGEAFDLADEHMPGTPYTYTIGTIGEAVAAILRLRSALAAEEG